MSGIEGVTDIKTSPGAGGGTATFCVPKDETDIESKLAEVAKTTGEMKGFAIK